MRDPSGKQLVIEELFAYVVIDHDGSEGVPSFQASPVLHLPMMGADLERADQIREWAQLVADQIEKPVHLYVWRGPRELMDTIKPRGGKKGG